MPFVPFCRSRGFVCVFLVMMAVGVPVAALAQAQEAAASEEPWPQFRGPGGSGIAAGRIPPPSEFGPATNRLWKTPLPAGHSSPVVWGDRIFLTAFDEGRKTLEVIGLNRTTGAILWRRDVPAEGIETVHQVSSPATATPAVDGEQVYVYFGSFGVLAYDFDGVQRWAVPMANVQVPFGSGTSPVVAGNLVIVNRHEPKDPFLVALDRRTGEIVWKQKHEIPAGLPIPFSSHSTPLVVGGQVVVHGPASVDAYDLATGERRWWVNVPSSGTSTPAVSGDTIFVATWYPFGEADQRRTLPAFATVVRDHDKDGSGTLAREEIPADMAVASRPDTPNVPGATITVRALFNRIDANKDGAIDGAEWDAARQMVQKLTIEHGLLAVRTDGKGDVTTTHVRWREKSSIPEVPSPIVHKNRVYMVRNGGIITCLDESSGKMLYRGRVGAGGPYFASPVAAGDKLFVASGEGTVSVLGTGGAALDVLAANELEEPIMATPAVSNGVIYVRTASGLSAFGGRERP